MALASAYIYVTMHMKTLWTALEWEISNYNNWIDLDFKQHMCLETLVSFPTIVKIITGHKDSWSRDF